MFIVTNREVFEGRSGLSAFGPSPNQKGPNELRLAEVNKTGRGWSVKILPDIMPQSMLDEAGVSALPTNAAGEEQPTYASRFVAHRLLARVNPAATGGPGKGRNLVFFVHGYNNDVQAVVERARRLEQTYGVEVIAYTWPARGGGVHGTASYKSDKRDALASTGALDRVLARFKQYFDEFHAVQVRRIETEANERFQDDAEKWDQFFTSQTELSCGFTVNMVLHSMGNYLYKHLLKSSTYRGDLLLFDNVVMIAADTNNEGHAEWVDRIQCRGRILITLNENDSALRASRLKMGESQKARLGHYPHRLNSQSGVYVDFTNEPFVTGSHAYFEGTPIRNRKIKSFFHDSFNGAFREERLSYRSSRNVWRVG